MSLQFIMGNSGAGKSRYAYEKILAEAARHPEKNYLIVVPEQFTMQTQKELVSLHPAGGILNIDILSFQRLAYRIFEETGGSLYPVLEETGKSLVVKRVAQEKKKELTILGSTLKRTGAVSQMKSLISELKQYQIAPSELDAWAEETGEKKLLAAKLKDTGVIYRAFEKYLENRYVTAEDVLEVLAGKLEESELIKNSEVLVDGFTGFTPVQIGVLGKLFRLCAKVYVTIIMDEREDPYKKAIPHQLFAMSRQLVQQLMKAADEAGCPVEPEIWVRRSGLGRFQPGSTMDQLEQRLFRYGKRGFSGNGIEKRPESGTEAKTGNPAAGYEAKQQGIYISVAPNPRAELEETVRLIRRMVREEGMRYQDFAVLTGDLSVYGTYAREIFEKCGVPYFVDEKHSVLMNPFVEFLRAAIEMVVQSFSYESVFRYLRCGLSSLDREETDAMENYVLALGIRGLKAYGETWTRGYRGIKPDEVPQRNLLREKFYAEVQPFAERMKKKDATVRERTEALYALAVQNQMQEKLEERRQQFEIRTRMIRHEQINGNGTHLRQILLNILTNAAKYTPDGGRIIFEITELDSEPGYAEYQFTISDNGMGMSQEFISTIFSPFTRAENSVTNKVQGTGLGMTITKSLVDMIGGRIDVQSEPGKGSRFTVTLKFKADENERSEINGMLMIGRDDDVTVSAKAHGVTPETVCSIGAAAELLSRGAYDVVLITSGICENISGDDISRLRGASEKPVKIAGICSDTLAQRFQETLDCAIVVPFFWGKLENGLADENEKEKAESGSALSGVRFLCAEDNEMNAVILEANLKWRGASCRIFPDGKSLVDYFAAADPGEYDMILMDVQMPLMNGYEAARAIRKSSNPDGKAIPIIAMTANAFSDDIRACLNAGMDAHISKPVDMSAFEKTVRSLREDKKRLVQRCKSDRSTYADSFA